jgi:3-deoxy-7-phosphoheptulonate synthase
MIALLEKNCPLRLKAGVVRFVEEAGFLAQVIEEEEGTRIGVIGNGADALAASLAALPGVREVRPGSPPYPLVSRERHPGPTLVRIDDLAVGGEELALIAGPCSVESREQILKSARGVAAAGARLLRGGAFKPRSSPYSFQGLGHEGLDLLAEAREATGLKVVTEVLGPEEVEIVVAHADVLQVGARNMQNFRLLSAVGSQPKPVLLKRGMMATLEELLLAAEYVVGAGNPRVILCERGIRTFETSTRYTLDISAVPALKERTHLPVIVDPSHAAGRRELIPALALSAVAAGADGLMVEVHPEPDRARSDGRQSLSLEGFAALVEEIRPVAAAVGRRVAAAVGSTAR